jgi:DNA-binding CsgD family transcriptional regulator
MPAGPSEERLLAHLDRVTKLPAIQGQLLVLGRVSTLLAHAAEAARANCGFRRAIILSVGHGELIAAETDALSDEASDQLRRRAIAEPIRLEPGTEEAELIRHAERAGTPRVTSRSVLAEALSLRHHAIGVIAPDTRALALLVVDRPDPPVDQLDRAVVEAFASMLAVALEQVVLRARVSELSHELRHLVASTQALMGEVLEAPVTLPADTRHSSAFLPLDAVHSGPVPSSELRELLSEREIVIAALLAEGRSNREIAEQLVLSPETIKTHVARILRKLNVSNRAEAVSRYLRLTRAGSG